MDHYNSLRRGAEVDFWSAFLGAQRQNVLPWGWTCLLTCQGQVSSDRLVPSEQYGLGGYDTVRGYRYRTIVSDEALNVRTELRTPVLPRFMPEGFDERVQLLAFTDAAWAWNQDAGAGELDNENLTGAGVGLRASFLDSAVTARVDAGWALEDLEATTKNEEGDFFIHFGVQYRY